MPEEASGGTSVPAATPAPVITPPPAVTLSTTVPLPTDESQPWFKERLDREAAKGRGSLLKELGVKDEGEIKAALDAARQAAESAKTTEQKRVEAEQAATALREENSELRGAVEVVAKARMAALTDTQREAVQGLAGDDAHAQIIAIDALMPTWASGAATPPKPATTSGPPGAPPAAGTGSPPDHRAVYAQLRQTNPFAAAAYGAAHPEAYRAPS